MNSLQGPTAEFVEMVQGNETSAANLKSTAHRKKTKSRARKKMQSSQSYPKPQEQGSQSNPKHMRRQKLIHTRTTRARGTNTTVQHKLKDHKNISLR